MGAIAGYWEQQSGYSADSLHNIVTRMGEGLRQRAVQTGTVWTDHGIALLQSNGAATACYSDERFCLALDGKIDNNTALAIELRAGGHAVKSEVDNVVVLAACAAWGVAATVPKLDGLFALALWDKQESVLTLARDPLGHRPLYWTQQGSGFWFGSELRALLQHPSCPRKIDTMALGHYFRTGSVPAPYCIFSGLHKLAPATMLTLKAEEEPVLTRYWDLSHQAMQPPDMNLGYEAATTQLHELLRATVQSQIQVQTQEGGSTGVLLSGGVGSSLIAALMQSQSSTPVMSYTVGFEDNITGQASQNTTLQVKAIAAHVGTQHHDVGVTAVEAQDVIPLLPEIFDEPFADTTQIPAYLMAKLVRQHGQRVCAGVGGHESFLGHRRYCALEKLESYPPWLWQSITTVAALLPPAQWNRLGAALPARWHMPHLGDRLVKLTAVGSSDVADAYRFLTSVWQDPEHLVPSMTPLPPVLSYPVPDDPIAAMQLWDTLGVLPDKTLTKLDRINMAQGLEMCLPLLDRKVLNYSWGLPRSYKLEQGVTKRILRSVLQNYVPDNLMPCAPRPAMPLAAWLRGTLREWAENLLAEPRLDEAGLESAPIRALWDDHLAGGGNHHQQLWTVLMYVAWRQHWNVYD